MKSLYLKILFMISANCITFGQNKNLQNSYLKDSLSVIQKRVEKSIIPARYMSQKVISETDTLSGWENVKVTLYEYTVDHGKKTGNVYMANADSRKIAAWIITTCTIVTNKLDKKNTDFLIQSIKNASGGQFPVKGIVYEDMDGKGYFPYAFKDGVTVFLNNKTDKDLSLITKKNIKKAGKYARIISTTREQYNAKFPERKTLDLEWLNVVRDEYKAALNSDVNNLMVAWAKDNIH